MILAFEIAEVRDYFVEGHRDQGAQCEPDRAEEPSPRIGQTPQGVRFADYEEGREAMIEALAGYEAARGLMSDAFLGDIREMISADRMDDAVALASSMPTDCVEKAMAWSFIAASGKRDLANDGAMRVAPTPPDARRARAMHSWMAATNAPRRVEEPFYEIAAHRAREVFEQEGHEALIEMIDQVPPFVGKVHLVMFARKNAPQSDMVTRPMAPRR
jgi:hypothetical protein